MSNLDRDGKNQEDRGPMGKAVQAAGRFLNPDNGRPPGLVHGSAKAVTVLIILGILLYQWTNGWGTLIVLVLAILIMLGRWLLERQAQRDFSDLDEATKRYRKTKNKKYMEFVRVRANQTLRDNKMLTSASRQALQGYLEHADKVLGKSEE